MNPSCKHGPGLQPRVFVVTGTDTGVGKTVLTIALLRHLRSSGATVAAQKPFCSGGRGDALALWHASTGALTLDEINPWHFRPALAPGLAARTKVSSPGWRDAVRHVRQVARKHQITVVEGAGGLLSPLTRDGDVLDLIRGLRATPLIVCPNRLGAIGQTRLVMRALTGAAVQRARIILMRQKRPDRSAPSNLSYLRERFGSERVLELPRLSPAELSGRDPLRPAVRRVLESLLRQRGEGEGTT